MNPLIRLKTIIQPLFIPLVLAFFALLPRAQAAEQPALLPAPPPDGGYAGFNTAEGFQALLNVNIAGGGAFNTAIGAKTLTAETTGAHNTAVGAQALLHNNGDYNTAVGENSLVFNTLGSFNMALGQGALANNLTGSNNTAMGFQALNSNNANFNTAVGFHAGFNHDTGNNNIYIGDTGLSSESNVIAIGALSASGTDYKNTFIGGAFGVIDANSIPLRIASDGHLATTTSSARFKKDIKPIDKASESILALKPVTFHYKNDGRGIPQFGLVAEDVAKVNPDLVTLDRDGKPYTVRYEEVNAMLLNEFLKEHEQVKDLKATIAQQEKQIEALTAGLQKVRAEVELSKPAPQTALNQ
jgi:Chaperone of endosialidase